MENIELESIGKLKPHPDLPDQWRISEKISIPFFDGKEMNFIFDNWSDDKSFFVKADLAISYFLKKDGNDRKEISPLIYKNYKNLTNIVGVGDYLPNIENKESIWKFVYPQEIFVSKRRRRDSDIYLQIYCECEWEVEHGLQIVFRQGKKVTRVSSIDGHLTEADAYDKPDEDDELLSKF